MSYRLLILEDNALLLETLEDFLSEKSFTCTLARNGQEALKLCYEQRFDLYLLDINVPQLNGFDFLKALRGSGDKTPAIFVTSYQDKVSVMQGFALGGDDYIKKPFDLDELLMRIKAVIARTQGLSDGLIVINETFTLNTERKRLLQDGVEVDLHLKDFELLALLVHHKGEVVTKTMIAELLWSSSEEVNEGSIRVYINNLKKIFGKEAISNIRGIGYRFEPK